MGAPFSKSAETPSTGVTSTVPASTGTNVPTSTPQVSTGSVAPPALPVAGVYIYYQPNYQGNATQVTISGSSTTAAPSSTGSFTFLTQPKSIQVSPGYQLLLYPLPNLGGNPFTYGPSSTLISVASIPTSESAFSYKVLKAGTGPGAPTAPTATTSTTSSGQTIGNSTINSIVTNAVSSILQTCAQSIIATGNNGQQVNLNNISSAQLLDSTVSNQCAQSTSVKNTLSANLNNQLQQYLSSLGNTTNITASQYSNLSSLVTTLQSNVLNQYSTCVSSTSTSQTISAIVTCILNSTNYSQTISSINNILVGLTSTSTTALPTYGYLNTNQPQYTYPTTGQQGSTVPSNAGYRSTNNQLSSNPYATTNTSQLNGYNVPQSPYSKPVVNVTAGQTPGFVNVYYADGSSAQVMQGSLLNSQSTTGAQTTQPTPTAQQYRPTAQPTTTPTAQQYRPTTQPTTTPTVQQYGPTTQPTTTPTAQQYTPTAQQYTTPAAQPAVQLIQPIIVPPPPIRRRRKHYKHH